MKIIPTVRLTGVISNAVASGFLVHQLKYPKLSFKDAVRLLTNEGYTLVKDKVQNVERRTLDFEREEAERTTEEGKKPLYSTVTLQIEFDFPFTVE